MRAITVTSFGEPEVLRATSSHPDPAPQADELLVKVSHSSINPIDWKTRRGLGWGADLIRERLPWVIGMDVVGEVAGAGADVDRGKWIGKRVAAFANLRRGGAHAEYTVVKAAAAAAIPQAVASETAAALPVAGVTSREALRIAMSHSAPGAALLVLGATGGMGHITCQLARPRFNPHAIPRYESDREYLEQLGANIHANHGQRYAAAIDLVGGDAAIAALKLLQPGGLMVTVPTITADAVRAAGARAGVKVEGVFRPDTTSHLGELLDLVAQGRLKIRVDSVYDADDIAAAHRRAEAGGVRSKIVIAMRWRG